MAYQDPLTQVPMATLQTWLAQAMAAYQLLMTGQNAVQVTDANGAKATYTQANKDALNAYVLRLQAIVNPVSGPSGVWGGPPVLAPSYGPCGGSQTGAPLRFLF